MRPLRTRGCNTAPVVHPGPQGEVEGRSARWPSKEYVEIRYLAGGALNGHAGTSSHMHARGMPASAESGVDASDSGGLAAGDRRTRSGVLAGRTPLCLFVRTGPVARIRGVAGSESGDHAIETSRCRHHSSLLTANTVQVHILTRGLSPWNRRISSQSASTVGTSVRAPCIARRCPPPLRTAALACPSCF